MKWKEMQRSVGNNRDMWRLDVVYKRCDEIPVQFPEVPVRRFQNLAGMRRNVVSSELEFIELKREAFLMGQHTLRRTKVADNMGVLPRYDECEDLVVRREVLHHAGSIW